MNLRADTIHTPDVALHFSFARDFASVIQQGILSQDLRRWLGEPIDAGPYKAQRQLGADLISVWDPWAFLKRHWRNCPLGSENRPWLIFDIPLDHYFDDPQDLKVACALRNPDPHTWLGVPACQAAIPRKRLDVVRRRLASIVEVAGPAPGVNPGTVRCWIDEELRRCLASDRPGETEVCLLLGPQLRRYDFPGYKRYENFVRYRIPPRLILGAVVDERVRQEDAVMRAASAGGVAIYLPDGTDVSP
jgi:hypothetical protein